jgi:hypothetical protein
MGFIIHATIHRADRSALRLVVEPNTFRTLVWDDVIEVWAHRLLLLVRIHSTRNGVGDRAFQDGSICKRPQSAAFVNRVVRALWLAGAAVDALVGYDDGHGAKFTTRCCISGCIFAP